MALKNKHDLGVHSEMITNSMVELVEAGVITGRKKNFMPGKMVGTFAYGTQKLYDMLEENPGVRMLRGETVNNPQIVAQNDNFVSINACLSVDLTGQVCSESIGSRQYSGSGGQADMAVGAAHSRNGRNIIATASTKHGGAVSTITAQLEARQHCHSEPQRAGLCGDRVWHCTAAWAERPAKGRKSHCSGTPRFSQ